VAEACYQRATDIQFSWDTVASQFGGIFEDVLKDVSHDAEKPLVTNSKKKRKKKKELAAVA